MERKGKNRERGGKREGRGKRKREGKYEGGICRPSANCDDDSARRCRVAGDETE